jgi:ABC-type polar amino acid transport system ATPase subunit
VPSFILPAVLAYRNMEKNMKPVVEFKSVSKWFGSFQVLNDINLEIDPGKKMVICGPSGSGKSTLIRCICGLESFDKGEMVLEPKTKVGMVFQQFNLFPHLSILDNLILAPMLVNKQSKKEAIERAQYYLNLVKIPEQSGKFPAQLSGGQQQRAAIARSLCMEPNLMLFDEPTSALDPEMIREVLDVIMMLAEQGMTLVCVTHEMSFAKRMADMVVFMSEGKIIEMNTPDVFFTAPKEARTQQFLSQIQQY